MVTDFPCLCLLCHFFFKEKAIGVIKFSFCLVLCVEGLVYILMRKISLVFAIQKVLIPVFI